MIKVSEWIGRVIAVAVAVAMVACGGGGGSPGQNPSSGALSVGGVTELTLLPGEARSLPVTGGVPPYRAVSSDTTAVAAAVDGNAVVVGGVAAGAKANVLVSDRAGAVVTMSVSVGTSVPLYTTAPANLTIGVGPAQARTFRVAGGVKPYVITGDAELVAAVTQLDAEHWRIEGRAIGSANVRIRDAAGKELTVAVTVGSPELRISSDNLTLPIGIPTTVVLSGGQKPYAIAGGIPAAIQVRPVVGTDDTFEIVGLLATGDVDVVFADASGKMVKTKVTVNTATTQIRVSPSALTLAEQSGTSVKFNVFTAAKGDLTVFSSHPGLVSVSAVTKPEFNPDGSIKTLGSFVGTVSGTCVAANTEVAITVVDSNASVGTATLTVANTNPAPCP